MPMSPPGSSQIFPAQPSMTGAVSQTPAGVQRPPGQSAGALQSFSQNVPLGSGPIPAGHKFRQGPSPHRTPGPPSLVLQPLVLPSITHVGSSGHPEGGAPKGAEAVATVALGSEADVAALAVALRATAEEALAVAEARARPDPGNATVLVVSLSFLSEHASAKVVAAASTKTRARMAGCYTGACAAGRESASGSGRTQEHRGPRPGLEPSCLELLRPSLAAPCARPIRSVASEVSGSRSLIEPSLTGPR